MDDDLSIQKITYRPDREVKEYGKFTKNSVGFSLISFSLRVSHFSRSSSRSRIPWVFLSYWDPNFRYDKLLGNFWSSRSLKAGVN